MKTQGTETVTGAVVSPIGTFSQSLTISGVPVATGTGSGDVSHAEVVSVSGSLQSQISAINADEIEPAIVGSNGIQVASGTSTITINGTSLLPLDGSRVMQAALRHFNGTVAAPGLSFSVDVDMGIYHNGKGVVAIAGNGLRVATFSGTTSKGMGVDGNVTATGTIASPSGKFSNSLTVSGLPVVTSIPPVAIPNTRIPFGSPTGVLTSHPGLSWVNVGTAQDVLSATHLAIPTSGTASDPWLHGGDTLGRTSGLYYVNGFGVVPIFTWSISGLDTVRLVGDFFLRRSFDVGVAGSASCNFNVLGRIAGIGNSVITLHSNTTAQRDALGLNDAPSNGSIHYNTTTSGFQGFRSGAWRDLVLSSGTGANIPQFTPSSSADAAGTVGDLTFGGTNLYLKTTTSGWVRFPSQTF